jgi:hypothetical protein
MVPGVGETPAMLRGRIMLELIALLAALALCIWTPIETRKVRNGWVRKNFKGTHAEFVARYRRQLTMFMWLGGVLGLGNLALALFTSGGDSYQIAKIIAGAIWLAASVVAFASRRSLDQPAVG